MGSKAGEIVAKVVAGIFAAVGGVVLLALMVLVAVSFGYLVGLFLIMIPFVAAWLTEGVGLDTTQVPTITAWIAVAGIFLKGSSLSEKTRKKLEE